MSNAGDLYNILGKLDSIDSGTTFVPETNLMDGNGKPIKSNQQIINEIVERSAEDIKREKADFINVLSTLNDLDGTPLTENQKNQKPVYNEYNEFSSPYDVVDEQSYIEEYDENGNFIAPTSVPQRFDYDMYMQPSNTPSQPSTPKYNGVMWEMVEKPTLGLQTIKTYSIKNTINSTTIIDNILMKECAVALLTVLNEGHSFSNVKVLGVISYGLQYSSLFTEAVKYMKERKQVLNESNYTRAQELDVVISQKKNEANDLKYKVLDFLRSEGFIKS